jgi:hypothetical protein
MTRLAALVFSAWVLLGGCAKPIYSYSKAGSDVTDFREDSYACIQEQEAQMSWDGSPVTVGASRDAKRQAHLYYMCMRARGWTAEAPQ